MFLVSKYVSKLYSPSNSKVYLTSVVYLALFKHYFLMTSFDFLLIHFFLSIYLNVHIPYLNIFICIV